MSDVPQEILDLVDRQARAWERNDFALGAGDWLPDGELVAPGARVAAPDLAREVTEFHRSYTDLVVTVLNVFCTEDRSKVGIEWDWEVTRRSDGVRGLTHDAIIVDLVDGKIASWREYFDLGGSVEAPT
ncbi:MAG: nuclear transport factor 2 family protein [Actinobacteria bacterium]|nr:MAG: nuclear transport factor 2 family protein [Actinomycetota bacterium]